VPIMTECSRLRRMKMPASKLTVSYSYYLILIRRINKSTDVLFSLLLVTSAKLLHIMHRGEYQISNWGPS
jgi:hypothetical protein